MGDGAATIENATLTAAECLEAALVQSESGEVLSGLWYVGVIMSIFSSIASNLGVNVQKLSMMHEMKLCQADPNYTERPYIFQRTWLVGLLLVIGGSVGDFAALGFAAQTLATPVGGFTMVANLFFAHFFLKEHLGRRDLVATGLVVIGVVAVAASADKADKTYTLACLLTLYQRTIFIVYVLGILLISGVLFAATRYLDKLRIEDPKGEKYIKYRKLHPIFPAALSGLIGAQSVLFAKCSAELIKTTFAGDSQFKRWETYLIIFCMFLTIFNQLHWLAAGLKYFDAILIIPVFQCFFITGGVVGGGVFFDEFSNLKLWERCTFAAGVLTTVFGVYLLSQREHEHPEMAKVTPEINQDGSPIIAGGAGQSSSKELHAASFSIGAERPPTPMPLSLQYHSLAMSDLYTALRDSLSTPERNPRRLASADNMRTLPHVEEVVLPSHGVLYKRHSDSVLQSRSVAKSAQESAASRQQPAVAKASDDDVLPVGPSLNLETPDAALVSRNSAPASQVKGSQDTSDEEQDPIRRSKRSRKTGGEVSKPDVKQAW